MGMNKDGKSKMTEETPDPPKSQYVLLAAVQNERQPRNTATIRPPIGMDLTTANAEQFFREYAGAVSAAVGVLASPKSAGGTSICSDQQPNTPEGRNSGRGGNRDEGNSLATSVCLRPA